MDENREDQPLSSEELLRRAREGLGESTAPEEQPADFKIADGLKKIGGLLCKGPLWTFASAPAGFRLRLGCESYTRRAAPTARDGREALSALDGGR